MKRYKKWFALLLVCTGLLGGCASSPENAPESTDSPAIATTSPAICEILDALGYDNVVGVPETTGDLPERYETTATIGAAMDPDLELIKSISPDIILSPKSLVDSLSEEYKAIGVESFFVDLSSVSGMYDSIEELGEMLGKEKESKALISDYENYLADYTSEEMASGNCMILMCYPSGYYLISTENSYVGSLVELAGAENVYADYTGDENGYASINLEDMLQKNPDKILVFAHYSEDTAFTAMEEEFENNSMWQYFDAVKNGEIYYLSSEQFGVSANLDWKDALEILKPIFYGE